MIHPQNNPPLDLRSEGVQCTSFDSTIIGAGGAGMCLLLAMHDIGYLKSGKVAVVEPLIKDGNDRTWCFWAKGDDPILRILKPIISASWKYCINSSGRWDDLYPYCYYQVRSQDLYRYVKDLIAGANILWIPERVVRVLPGVGESKVITTNSAFHSKWIFDSRLTNQQVSALENEYKLIWQSFYGWKVKFSREVLCPEAFTMMSFNVEQQNATQFLYILPYNRREALVELTRFSPDLLNLDVAQNILDKWIKENLGHYSIIDYEEGKIPMTQNLSPSRAKLPTKSLIQIGTAGGAVKSSTGYAFKRMVDHAISLVASLHYERPLQPLPVNRKAAFYDSLLINILKEEPRLGKKIFTRLFDKISTPRILRFLDEKSSIVEEIPILASLPPQPFLRSLFELYISKKKSK